MTGILFLVGPNNEKQGTVEVLPDRVEWSYTGPDPDGQVEEYLKRVENKEAYDWHEEIRDEMTVGQDEFDRMYLTEIYKQLDYFDHPHRVVTKGL